MGENKRTQQRFDRHIEIEYTLGGETRQSVTRNLSLGGVYIEAQAKVAYGTRLNVKFKVPTQKEAIETGAIVRWSDSAGFGVQFDGLRARDVWALGKFFEQP